VWQEIRSNISEMRSKPNNRAQTHFKRYTPNLWDTRCLSLGHHEGNPMIRLEHNKATVTSKPL